MTSSLDELLNAEFKEAFDEFDKVNKLARFSSLAKESLVEKRSQPFFPQITFDSFPKIGALEILSIFYLLCTSEFQLTILLNYAF